MNERPSKTLMILAWLTMTVAYSVIVYRRIGATEDATIVSTVGGGALLYVFACTIIGIFWRIRHR